MNHNRGKHCVYLVWIGISSFAACDRPAAPPLVFAAASTARVLPAVAAEYSRGSGQAAPRFSFAASSTLARQIEQGAPAAIFLAAAPLWVDHLRTSGRIVSGSRRNLLGNRLVLIGKPIVQQAGSATVTDHWNDDPRRSPTGRMAIGDPEHVPAGIYARQALQRRGLWSALKGRLVPARDVRAALRYVATGECDYGIVYSTETRGSAVRILDTFTAAEHDPIRYPVVRLHSRAGQAEPGGVASPTERADQQAADAFYKFLFSPEAARVFEEQGFERIAAPAPLKY